ncbi:MAG: alpha/beta hydrolase [Bacteroidetes bacterium]|nr:alpha/beta hydrolase [Bacteroidota bacterium]
MNHTKSTFPVEENVKLFCQSWLPETTAKAVLVIIHGGNGDHSSRYMNVVNHFVNSNYAVYSYDQRGSGHSPGVRGYVKNWTLFRNDLSTYLQLIQKEQPQLPVFLFGHSLGGMTLLDYILKKPDYIKAAICSAPAIGKIEIPPFLWTLSKMLDKVWPNLAIKTGMDVKAVSRVPEVIEEAKNDTLYHGKGTPRLAMQIKSTSEWIHQNAGNLSAPLLMIHGTSDRVASIEGSRRFMQNVTFEDATLKEYEGGYHELFNDLPKEQVLKDVSDWMEAHI